MSYFVLGCPACSGGLQISMHQSLMKPFKCVRCGAAILLSRSMALELSNSEPVDFLALLKPEKDKLLELLIDAAGYGAFYHELSERDSGMSVAKDAQSFVKSASRVRRQMEEWLKVYRDGPL